MKRGKKTRKREDHVMGHGVLAHVAEHGTHLERSCVSHCLNTIRHAHLYNHWILSLYIIALEFSLEILVATLYITKFIHALVIVLSLHFANAGRSYQPIEFLFHIFLKTEKKNEVFFKYFKKF